MSTVTGTTGNDTLSGLATDDSVDGKGGIDVFILTGVIGAYGFGFDLTNGAVTVTGPDGADTLQGIEMVRAADGIDRPLVGLVDLADPVFTATVVPAPTIGNDHLQGTDLAEYLGGGYGDDSIACGAGNDWAFGGPGDDIVLGQADDDHLEGHVGNDALFGGDGNDGINGDLIGQTGNDYLAGGSGNDWIAAGSGADILLGGADNDWLFGEYGPDQLNGGSGNDVLIGDFFASRYVKPVAYPKDPPNDDALVGGAGNDFLMGGLGADLLEGGPDVIGSSSPTPATALRPLPTSSWISAGRRSLSPRPREARPSPRWATSATSSTCRRSTLSRRRRKTTPSLSSAPPVSPPQANSATSRPERRPTSRGMWGPRWRRISVSR